MYSPGTLWVTRKQAKTPKASAFDMTAIHNRLVLVRCLSSHPKDQLATRMTASVSSKSRITLAACTEWRLPMVRSYPTFAHANLVWLRELNRKYMGRMPECSISRNATSAIEPHSVHRRMHRWRCQSGRQHAFTKADLRVSIKDFHGNKCLKTGTVGGSFSSAPDPELVQNSRALRKPRPAPVGREAAWCP